MKTKATKTPKTETTKSKYDNVILLEPGDHVRMGNAQCSTYCVVSIRDDKARVVSILDPLNEQIIPRDCIASRRVARMGNNGAQDYLNRHIAAVEANKSKAVKQPVEESMTKTVQKLESNPVKPIKNPRGGLAVTPAATEPALASVKPGGLAPVADAMRKAEGAKVEKAAGGKTEKKAKAKEDKKAEPAKQDKPVSTPRRLVLRGVVAVDVDAVPVVAFKYDPKGKVPEKVKGKLFDGTAKGYKLIFQLLSRGDLTRAQVAATAFRELERAEDPDFEWDLRSIWAMALYTKDLMKRAEVKGGFKD